MSQPENGISVVGAADVGEVRFIATSGGTHPPEAWASISTDDVLALIQIEPTGSQATIRAMAVKDDLRPKLMALFTAHYRMTQSNARLTLAHNKSADEQIEPYILGVVQDLNRLMATTPYAEHFAREPVREKLFRITGQHTVNVIHIERKTRADKQGD
jgi:hypothetical protein